MDIIKRRDVKVASLFVVGLAVCGVLWWSFQPPRELTYQERSSRTSPEIDRSLVDDLDLQINGEDFGSVVHSGTIDQPIKVTGRVAIDLDEFRKRTSIDGVMGMASTILVFRFEPKGAPENRWSSIADKKSLFVPILPFFPDREIERNSKLRSKHFTAGEYDVRLYLRVDVKNTKIQFVHYLASGEMTIRDERE